MIECSETLIDDETKKVHASCHPIDLHLDAMTSSWLFGTDIKKNLRCTWKAKKNKFLLKLIKAFFPKGKHMPLFNHADILRMIEGGCKGACFPAHANFSNIFPYIGNPWKTIEQQYKFFQNTFSDPKCSIVRTPDELEKTIKIDKIAAIFSVEGAHCLGPVLPYTRKKRLCRLKRLRTQYGAAYITVSHFCTTDVSTSSLNFLGRKNDPDKHITKFGRQFVETANNIGLILDLSHTNRQGILDITKSTKKPVIASHAGVFEIAQSISPNGKRIRRMIDLKALTAIKSTGGCVSVMLSPFDLHGNKKNKDGCLDLVVEHYNFLKEKLGYKYISLGTDFDGGIASIPKEMKDIADLPRLTQKLLNAHWTKKEIQSLYYKNFLRVWKENLG